MLNFNFLNTINFLKILPKSRQHEMKNPHQKLFLFHLPFLAFENGFHPHKVSSKNDENENFSLAKFFFNRQQLIIQTKKNISDI